MIKFILNNQTIETALPTGTTVLDFVRYRKNLKGTKIGCREGDCGACTVLVGELHDGRVKYRSQTSCLMPLANAAGKHIVTVEGVNPADGELTPVQSALVDESGTQCGFCTVGFVMSLTGFCLDDAPKSKAAAVSAIDGNICRCTGYKSIERAAARLCDTGEMEGEEEKRRRGEEEILKRAIETGIVPAYFAAIKERLASIGAESSNRASAVDNPKSEIRNPKSFVSGGTDLYVQRPEEMAEMAAENLFDRADLRLIEEAGEMVEVGAAVVVTDLMESDVFQRIFPDLYRHLKLVSSTPIRNMATLAGNFVNASPIGDMTAWFLALDAEIELVDADDSARALALRDFYRGYKQLAKKPEEYIRKISFRKDFTHFNFEKVCKRTYLDIASVNSAIGLKVAGNTIERAHAAVGGVFATPLYLRKTSEFLRGREITEEIVSEAAEILQTEIAPISDVRGTAEYKRLLARQLFTAHFAELFGV
ncbi:MAG: FAD binding domain-containing protein [Acidobacteria bacterium]|nr:FAD binding domain-containing protein [Acidobacteriota bacterium]